MTEAAFNNVLLSLVGGMFLILCGLIGFIGTRMSAKIDALGVKIDTDVHRVYAKIDTDYRLLQSNLDEVEAKQSVLTERMVAVESKCSLQHGPRTQHGYIGG